MSVAPTQASQTGAGTSAISGDRAVPAATRIAPDATAFGAMTVLCVLWGLQQVAIKVAAPAIHPVMQTALRSVAGALLVAMLMLWRRENFSLRDGTFLPGAAAGMLFAAEFFCIALGLTYTTASHMSVFLYTAPVFTVLGLQWLVPGERLQRHQWLGIVMAFSGIAVAFSGGLANAGGDWRKVLMGDALGVLAGLLWAATTVVIRSTRLSEAPSSRTLLYQLGISSLLLLPVSLALGHAGTIRMTPIAWGSMVFQAVVVTFASYLVWFWILRRYLAARISVFSFLTPLCGVGFGVLLLDDPIDASFAFGAVLVLSGIVMVNVQRARA